MRTGSGLLFSVRVTGVPPGGREREGRERRAETVGISSEGFEEGKVYNIVE